MEVLQMDFPISSQIQSLKPSATEEVDNKVEDMEQEGVNDIISLGVGEPCFDTPEVVKKAAKDALNMGKTKYQPTAGDYELRSAVCDKFQRDNGIEVKPSQVMITVGAKFAIFLSFQAILDPGDKIMLLEPAWVTYEPAAKIAGADVVHVPSRAEEGFLPDLDLIDQNMDDSVKIIVLNTPCNPTGAVFPKKLIRQITELAKQNDTFILADEPYEYLIYEGKHYSPGSDFENVITINAFSKSHAMTGWRLGYVTAPYPILENMKKIYQHSASCVTAFCQPGGIVALQDQEAEKEKQKMISGYRKRRGHMVNLIKTSSFFELDFTPPGAFYCFPSYNLNIPSVELSKKLLEEAHVATVPGSAFGQSGEGYVRLSYSTSMENITKAFQRLDEYFK